MVAGFGSIFKTHYRDSRIKPTLGKPHLRLLLHVIFIDRFGKEISISFNLNKTNDCKIFIQIYDRCHIFTF